MNLSEILKQFKEILSQFTGAHKLIVVIFMTIVGGLGFSTDKIMDYLMSRNIDDKIHVEKMKWESDCEIAKALVAKKTEEAVSSRYDNLFEELKLMALNTKPDVIKETVVKQAPKEIHRVDECGIQNLYCSNQRSRMLYFAPTNRARARKS